MEGKTALGASSPANPALHMPEPLSTTRAAVSSSHILFFEDLLENQMIKQESEVDLRLGSNTGLGVRSPLLIDKF